MAAADDRRSAHAGVIRLRDEEGNHQGHEGHQEIVSYLRTH